MGKIVYFFSFATFIFTSLHAYSDSLEIVEPMPLKAELVDDVYFEHGNENAPSGPDDRETYFVARDAKTMDVLWEYREGWSLDEAGGPRFISPIRKDDKTYVVRMQCQARPHLSCEQSSAELVVFSHDGKIESRNILNLESRDYLGVSKLEWLPNGDIAIFASWKPKGQEPFKPLHYTYHVQQQRLTHEKIDIPIAKYWWGAKVLNIENGFAVIYAFHDVVIVDNKLKFVKHTSGFDPDLGHYSHSIYSRVVDSRILSNGNIVTTTRRFVQLDFDEPSDLLIHILSPKGEILAKKHYIQSWFEAAAEPVKILEVDNQIYLLGLDITKKEGDFRYSLFRSTIEPDGTLTRLQTQANYSNFIPMEFNGDLLLVTQKEQGWILEKRNLRTFDVLKTIKSPSSESTAYFRLDSELEVLERKEPTPANMPYLFSPIFNMTPGDSFWMLFYKDQRS